MKLYINIMALLFIISLVIGGGTLVQEIVVCRSEGYDIRVCLD